MTQAIEFNETDVAYLEKHMGVWIVLRDAGYMNNLGNDIRQEFLEIYRRSIDARALYCLTCSPDLYQLVRILFSQFEFWKKRQPVPEVVEEVIKKPATKKK